MRKTHQWIGKRGVTHSHGVVVVVWVCFWVRVCCSSQTRMRRAHKKSRKHRVKVENQMWCAIWSNKVMLRVWTISVPQSIQTRYRKVTFGNTYTNKKSVPINFTKWLPDLRHVRYQRLPAPHAVMTISMPKQLWSSSHAVWPRQLYLFIESRRSNGQTQTMLMMSMIMMMRVGFDLLTETIFARIARGWISTKRPTERTRKCLLKGCIAVKGVRLMICEAGGRWSRTAYVCLHIYWQRKTSLWLYCV